MLKKILLAVAVLIVVFVIVVATRPAAFTITRSVTIAASPAVVFAQVNDLHAAQAWSPWMKLDPAAQYTFEGPTTGVGATLAWTGNSDVGAGRENITESRPGELVRIKIEFFKPMAGICWADFGLKPAASQTVISWTMSGENNFIAKAFCMFVNQDKMIGDQFEQGLASLKTICEAAAKK